MAVVASEVAPGRIWCSSAVIRRMSYNKKLKRLIVIFHGNRRYDYTNVPQTVWDNFKKTRSIGKFYNRYIKGKYIATKVEPKT